MIDAYLAGTQLLRQAVAGMSREQLTARPIPRKWSTLEVVCHLADSDLILSDRMKRVIAEDRPSLISLDESRYAAALACHNRVLEEELALVEHTRRQLARILRNLPPEALAREGIHSEYGPRTLEQLLQTSIDHIPHHVKFILDKRRALGLA
jgi:hypothetical protein